MLWGKEMGIGSLLLPKLGALELMTASLRTTGGWAPRLHYLERQT